MHGATGQQPGPLPRSAVAGRTIFDLTPVRSSRFTASRSPSWYARNATSPAIISADAPAARMPGSSARVRVMTRTCASYRPLRASRRRPRSAGSQASSVSQNGAGTTAAGRVSWPGCPNPTGVAVIMCCA